MYKHIQYIHSKHLVNILFILVLFKPMITDLFVIIHGQLKEVVMHYNYLF